MNVYLSNKNEEGKKERKKEEGSKKRQKEINCLCVCVLFACRQNTQQYSTRSVVIKYQ
jgi:hypothetical protein